MKYRAESALMDLEAAIFLLVLCANCLEDERLSSALSWLANQLSANLDELKTVLD